MKYLIFLSFITVFTAYGFGQTISISGNDTLCDCSNAASIFNQGTANFIDVTGGVDYSSNMNDTITFCPDGGASKIGVAFGINSGFTWDVDGSDSIYVYDGPNTSSPLMGVYNSVTNPNGFNDRASWENTSGCLTIVFISDGADEGTGWEGLVSCATPMQPYDVHMQAYINGEANGANDIIGDLIPNDSGYVDVCFGDSIMFVALPDFPYDPSVTGQGGYDQVNTYTTEWLFSDGMTTSTNDTVWFKPNSRNGFLVTLIISDTVGQVAGISSVVRVSTIPSFATCRALNDTICEGQATELFGGITPGDTVGVDPTQGSVALGGNFQEIFELPDGSGINYETEVLIASFPAGLTVQNSTDIVSLCINMEHSFIGDLEMQLICPNGQTADIFNSFDGFSELIPDGFEGGGDYIGGAYDNNTGNIGVCEEYCFSDISSAMQSWDLGYTTTNATGPSSGNMIIPGLYNPEEAFFPALQGCPINGSWTIRIRDNRGVDDGFICSWGIEFDAVLNPNHETYTPSIVSEFWSPDPTIITGSSDTAILVAPPIGTTGYVFNVEDSYGCAYDTIINVEALQGPSISGPLVGCIGPNAGVQFSNTFAPEGGVWSAPSELTNKFSPTFINQGFTSNTAGTFTVTFIDNLCNETLEQQVTFSPEPSANIVLESSPICRGDSMLLTVETSDPNNVIWNNDLTMTSASIYVSEAGIYTAEVTNQCGSAADNFELFLIDCKVPNVITPNGDGQNDKFFTNIAETYPDTEILIFNRWGGKVYKNENYDNSWNGVDNGGNKLSSGTYYYIISYDNDTKSEKGFITIME